jgi:serine/threonine protein kinase
MARVYKAYHPHLRREVAIKVILAERADLASFQARFKLEAQMIASLDHPHIVRVYDFGEQDDLAYLVMQYVSGGTLREQLRERRPLVPGRATRYAIQMAQALHHAHQHGIIHRDVKPQNMLVSSADANQLLLSDFGIAKLYTQASDIPVLTEAPTHNAVSLELSSASQIIGTADYMAPEQARGQAVDARTDVYALGVVLFQMLTGEKPFYADSLHGLLVQHVATPAPWVRASNPHVPETLARITAKALAKSPDERFQSAEEMAFALEQANSNATHRLFSFPEPMAPQPMNSSSAWAPPSAYPQAVPERSSTWTPAMTGAPGQVDPYRTLPSRSTGPGHASITSAPGAQSAAYPGHTPSPRSRANRALLRISSVLLSLLVIAGLLLGGVHVFTSNAAVSSGSASSHGGGSAQAFHERFQNNQLNWLVGNVSPGVSLSTPGNGVYTTTISSHSTAFPYPQAVGLLPDTFTLTAVLQQTAGAPDDTYGLAFHFAQDSSGYVSSYAFIIASNGRYAIDEYLKNNPITIAAGTYQTGTGPHTLTVKAQGSNYTFVLDQRILQIAIGAQAPAPSWNNNDLRGGHLALLFAGPNTSEGPTSFEATDVQLSIP